MSHVEKCKNSITQPSSRTLMCSVQKFGIKLQAQFVTQTNLNRRQGSLVGEASAVTNETRLSSAVEVRSSHQLGPEAVNELSAQSSHRLQAGTTGPLADPTRQTSNITRLKARVLDVFCFSALVCSSVFVCFRLYHFSFLF